MFDKRVYIALYIHVYMYIYKRWREVNITSQATEKHLSTGMYVCMYVRIFSYVSNVTRFRGNEEFHSSRITGI